jgi:8-oxo-dGTP diphosphatase
VPPARSPVHVVAGVLRDTEDRVLITERPVGKSQAGRWEFPGGKKGDDEGRFDALRREFQEELGLLVGHARPLIRYRHDYPEFSVDLDVWLIRECRGEPRGLEGQAMDWVAPEDLMAHDLLPADRPIATALQLPDRYLVTGSFQSREEFEERLGQAVDAGIRLVQLRIPGADSNVLAAAAKRAQEICAPRGAALLINGEPIMAAEIAASVGARGIHVPARYLERDAALDPVPTGLVGVSCHDRTELSAAIRMGADFAVVSPVQPTASHPGAAGLGWEGFRELVAGLPLPVYALGGMNESDLDAAWNAGAIGVAGISAFW